MSIQKIFLGFVFMVMTIPCFANRIHLKCKAVKHQKSVIYIPVEAFIDEEEKVLTLDLNALKWVNISITDCSNGISILNSVQETKETSVLKIPLVDVFSGKYELIISDSENYYEGEFYIL